MDWEGIYHFSSHKNHYLEGAPQIVNQGIPRFINPGLTLEDDRTIGSSSVEFPGGLPKSCEHCRHEEIRSEKEHPILRHTHKNQRLYYPDYKCGVTQNHRCCWVFLIFLNSPMIFGVKRLPLLCASRGVSDLPSASPLGRRRVMKRSHTHTYSHKHTHAHTHLRPPECPGHLRERAT